MKLQVGDWVKSGLLSGVEATGEVLKAELLEGDVEKYTIYFPAIEESLIVYGEQIVDRE